MSAVVVEAHYSVAHLALLIQMSERFIRDRIKEGAFGPDGVYNFNGDLRIKASAWNAWAATHRHQPGGIFARSEGELRRKIAQQAKRGA